MQNSWQHLQQQGGSSTEAAAGLPGSDSTLLLRVIANAAARFPAAQAVELAADLLKVSMYALFCHSKTVHAVASGAC